MGELSVRLVNLSPEKRALLEQRLRQAGRQANEAIAITGMGCRFPGGADSPGAFWRLLRDGMDAVSETPAERWDLDGLYDPDSMAPGKIATRWGGFLDQVDRFDAAFFGISPREAVHMDPQQRLLLEVAWDAFEDAGQSRERLTGTATGVFVGVHSHASDYLWLQYAQPETMDAFTGTGTAHNLLAGRLSYLFDLHGPSIALDTACSSSLVAVHLAVQSLRLRESDLALAAGVNLILTPHFSIAASRMHMLAADGRCKAFDHRADGFVRGEGCGAVVLKRLSDALADGDLVLAVIRGSAANQDGHTNGVTAPNGLAQRAVIERALKDAGVTPEEIGYVESHGTGTALGDPIEIEALAATIGHPRSDETPCLIGSVKTNFGHLEGAAGIVGLIKATLVVKHGEVPPNLHFTRLNPHISVQGTRLEFPTDLRRWDSNGRPRLAGVSSFGWSGTNAHVVLEEAPPQARPAATRRGDHHVLPISARSPGALRALAQRYRDLLAIDGERPEVGDLCYTAGVRRSHHDHRLAVVGRSASELGAAIDAALRSSPAPVPEGRPRVVFVFPGQGSQWLGMGSQLLGQEPAFRGAIEACDAEIRAEAGWSLLEELQADAASSRLSEIDIVQPALFAIEVALAALWRSWGIAPDAVVGHSMGEVAAAHVAGALTLADAVRVICRRSRLLRQIAGRGAMAVVELPVDEAHAALVGFEDRLSVAVSNGPRSTVLSGDPAALDAVMARLARREVFCRPVKVDVASHSPQVDALRPALLRELAGVVPAPTDVPVYSTVTAAVQAGDAFEAEYWVRNLRERVRFFDAVRELLSDRHDAFIEMSPHPILLPAVEDVIGHADATAVCLPSLRREEDERGVLLSGLASMYAHGADIDWKHLFPSGGASVTLPRYPWQGERFWLKHPPRSLPVVTAPDGTERGPRADTRGWLYVPEWRATPRAAGRVEGERGRWLVLADHLGRGDALARRLVSEGHEAVVAWVGDGFQCTGPGEFVARAAEPEDVPRLLNAALEPGGRLLGIVHLWNLNAGERAETVEALEQAQVPGCASIVRLIQDIVRRQLERPPRLFIVTEGAQVMRAKPVAVVQAPAWGLGRVIAEEHPECWGGLLDLDPEDQSDRAGSLLFDEITQPGGEDGIAFHRGERLILRLVPFDADRAARPLTCRPDASYLVTGGLGGVGLEVARWLVERGARRLVLVGRTVLPPRGEWRQPSAERFRRQINGIWRLEALGASVHAVSLDIADRPRVQAFLEAFRGEGWPPIRGVVHAAATAEDCLVAQLDEGRLLSVLRPKVAGSFILDRALADEALDFMVFFSSLGSVLGQPGQANYAAANAFLDALAFEIRRRGGHALAINWGAWADLGLAQTAGARRTIEELEHRGIGSFTADQGLDALGRLLDADAIQAAVAPVDWARFGEAAARTRVPSIVRDLARGNTPEMAAPAQVSSVREQIVGSNARDRRALLEAHLQDQLAAVLRLPVNKIELHRPMGTFGLESLTALEFRKGLEVSLGLRLSATVVWNYPTVAVLAEYLASRMDIWLGGETPAAARPVRQEARPIARELLRDIQDLSENEALRALLGKEREPR